MRTNRIYEDWQIFLLRTNRIYEDKEVSQTVLRRVEAVPNMCEDSQCVTRGQKSNREEKEKFETVFFSPISRGEGEI